MIDQENRRTEATIEESREWSEMTPVSGTILLDDDLEGMAGGVTHIGEEIPQ
jgi:hypothetical protein